MYGHSERVKYFLSNPDKININSHNNNNTPLDEAFVPLRLWPRHCARWAASV